MATPNLGLTDLAVGASDNEAKANETFRLIEAVLAQGVIRRDLTAPPGGESDGDTYIPAATATGAWATHEDDLAYYSSGTWLFVPPVEGLSLRMKDENLRVEWNGSVWRAKNGIQTLVDAATINWNLAFGLSAVVSLGGNRTMAEPTNGGGGDTITLTVIQDGTGSRTIAWDSAFLFPGGTPPTLSTGAGALDILHFSFGGGSVYQYLGAQLNLS